MKPIRIVLAPTRSRHLNLFLGLVLLLVSLLLFLALATWHAADPSLNTATATEVSGSYAVHNWIGLFGSYLSDLLLQALGITSFLLPLWLGGIGWTWMRSRPSGSVLLRGIGTLLAIVFLPAVFALTPWHWHWMHVLPVEGVMGRLVAAPLVAYLNLVGAWLVAGALAIVGLYYATAISIWVMKEAVENTWLHLRSWLDRWNNWREQRAERREERRLDNEIARDQDDRQAAAPALHFPPVPTPDDADAEQSIRRPSLFASLFGRRKRASESDFLDEIPAFKRAPLENPGTVPAAPLSAASASAAPVQSEEPIPIAPPVRKSIWERTASELLQPASASATPAPANVVPSQPVAVRPIAASRAVQSFVAPSFADPSFAVPQPAQVRLAATRPEAAAASGPAPAPWANGEIAIHGRADAEVRTATVAPKNVSGFKLPPSTLLNAGEGPQKVREDELRQEAKVLVEKCAEFDVRGQVVQINPGPMVTTYEFKPEAGVKYSRVTGLADDLCLAMRAESILIERMAGKSTVGIQVPNHERETIHLRDVLESETFAKAKSRLTLAMGKDINGRIVTADLNVMPHVLIAGSTGSGKSVAINAMIMSLLFRTTPSQVRLILVDPKRVELGMYEGIPHLFTPIITEPKLAANALRNAVREMERRLKLLASRSVRNIDQYNKLFEGVMPSLFDEGENEEPLPYIVIIIDELADLMMLDKANVEESITRLAQMARAVGIHLILATQRPSVDVITGLIKANVPTRISFRLATKVDSRTILDTNGAEALLGRGDMLFLPPGTSRLLRLHAPYVSEKETSAVVAFWKEQGQAEYVEGFLESPKDERATVDGSNPDPDENDPMFDDAVRLVFEFGKASTSLLQRRLRIGYGRAAHLIDLMERDGLVGPADGSRPRELLKAPGWLHEVMAGNE